MAVGGSVLSQADGSGEVAVTARRFFVLAGGHPMVRSASLHRKPCIIETANRGLFTFANVIIDPDPRYWDDTFATTTKFGGSITVPI